MQFQPSRRVDLVYGYISKTYVGFSEVEHLAGSSNIQLRTGCFCNPGACQHYLELQNEDILANADAGHICGDDMDLINGRPTGAVRLSIGYMTTMDEILRFVKFVKQNFITYEPIVDPNISCTTAVAENNHMQLMDMYIFPIKSCAAMRVNHWRVDTRGLLFDREWAIVDSKGVVLRLKQEPKLSMIEPIIDLRQQTLTVTASRLNMEPLTLKLGITDGTSRRLRVCDVEHCGVDQACSDWFSRCLGYGCTLVRRDSTARNFSNEGEFLLVSSSSVRLLNHRIGYKVPTLSFRPNFVVSGAVSAHDEDTWKFVQIGDVTLDVVGTCKRCSQINVHPFTGDYSPMPLKALSKYRRCGSKINFGILLTLSPRKQCSIGVGDLVTCIK